MSQGAGSTPLPMEEAVLDLRKKQLEVEKLEAEVATAKRPWWKRALQEGKAPEWITAAVAVGTVSAVFATGYFSASRERLAAQGDRLAVEKIEMEQKRDRATAELTTKEKELADVKQRLNPFEEEEEAIKRLRELKLENVVVEFATDTQFDGLSVSIRRAPWDISWDFSKKNRSLKSLPLAISDKVDDLLKPLTKFRKLKGVKINSIRLVEENLGVLSASKVESIGLKNCDLTTTSLAALNLPESVQYLLLQDNPLTSLESLPSSKNVVSLTVRDCPLTDDGLIGLAARFPKLKHLDLHGTQVTDAGVNHLIQVRSLVNVIVSSTAITGQGLQRLEKCPILHTIQMDKAQGAEALDKYFEAKHRFMQVWHEDTKHPPVYQPRNEDE